MSNEVFTRPSITLGYGFITSEFPFRDHAEDVLAFNELRTQYRKVQALVSDLNAGLVSLRAQSSQAHKDLAADPSAEAVAKAEDIRQRLASSEVETKRSIAQLQTNLRETVHAKLPPVAAGINRAIGEWLIQLSASLEQTEKALAEKYEASGFVPSELVRALVYRAASFYDAAKQFDRGIMSNISNPDSTIVGDVLVPEVMTLTAKK